RFDAGYSICGGQKLSGYFFAYFITASFCRHSIVFPLFVALAGDCAWPGGPSPLGRLSNLGLHRINSSVSGSILLLGGVAWATASQYSASGLCRCLLGSRDLDLPDNLQAQL